VNFSVLLSVYAKERPAYFNLAFSSIWDQQTLKPNQIVLVKDGPLTPGLDAEIKRWRVELGEVLTLVELPVNVGLANALNQGLKHCKYEVVARMDTDDVALPHRFEKQIKLIHQGYDLVGGSILEVDEKNQPIAIRQPPMTQNEIQRMLSKRSPFNHMTVVFRKEFVRKCGGYPSFLRKQDYALWATMISKGASVANTADILVRASGGRNMYQRRGGLDYVKSEVALQRHLLRCGVTILPKAFLYGTLRSVVFLIPPRLRGWVYETFFRKAVQA
jgi:glycosyltransferase involved in cell wall biosynthesis